MVTTADLIAVLPHLRRLAANAPDGVLIAIDEIETKLKTMLDPDMQTVYLVVKPENIISPSVYIFANEEDRDAYFATIGESENAYTAETEIRTEIPTDDDD